MASAASKNHSRDEFGSGALSMDAYWKWPTLVGLPPGRIRRGARNARSSKGVGLQTIDDDDVPGFIETGSI
jgi:hypothetical protein